MSGELLCKGGKKAFKAWVEKLIEIQNERLTEYRPLTLKLIFQILKIMSLGETADIACRILRIRPSVAHLIERTVYRTGECMWFSQPSKDVPVVMGYQNPLEYLQRVNEQGWTRMVMHAEKQQVPVLEEPLSLDQLSTRLSTR